jgi:oligoendopeptidase F
MNGIRGKGLTFMSEMTLPTRSEVPEETTWNAEALFENDEAWEAAYRQVFDRLPELDAIRGRLNEGVNIVLQAFSLTSDLLNQAEKLQVYAGFAYSVDTTNQKAAGRNSKAQGLVGKVKAATAFVKPELITLGEETLREWMQASPDLQAYEHFLQDLFREAAHVRSVEVEEILGALEDPFSGTDSTASIMTDADFKFQPAVNHKDNKIPVTQSTLYKIFYGSDRKARRSAWISYTDLYLAYKNTLASNLATSIKQNVFLTQARRHETTLEAALFENNIPVEVYHNLIETFIQNLPTWHRYFDIRKRALGVERLEYYDIWAPLTDRQPEVSYPQAVEWICEGLQPMGGEYVETVRQGCLEERWVDVYPNQGKRKGAFSWGAPGTPPYIMMSFNDNLLSLSTLAHELGHSMHSKMTWEHQPYLYCDYSLFVAEVASNFHQALVRAHLLENHDDPYFQISVIEEAMANFHRYFLIMPNLARFELEMHQRVERGEGLTADEMNEFCAQLFREAYGETMHLEQDRIGILWAHFGHLYVDYYVYAYATGIAGANALARRILEGEPKAVEEYLSFLRAGASMYPIDVLKMAGVDLTKPEPVATAFGVLSDMVDKLEGLLTAIE